MPSAYDFARSCWHTSLQLHDRRYDIALDVQGGGLLGYVDALSGGSISRVGIFSLGMRGHEAQAQLHPASPVACSG